MPYTDGVIEAESEAGVRFSTDRLVYLVRAGVGQSAARLVDSICASVAAFASGREPGDDVTVVILKALWPLGSLPNRDNLSFQGTADT